MASYFNVGLIPKVAARPVLEPIVPSNTVISTNDPRIPSYITPPVLNGILGRESKNNQYPPKRVLVGGKHVWAVAGDYNSKKNYYRALGPYQLHDITPDINKRFNTKFTPADRLDPDKSRQMAAYYLAHMGEMYMKRKAREDGTKLEDTAPPTPRELLAMYNGGPRGYEKTKALEYADDIINNSGYFPKKKPVSKPAAPQANTQQIR